MRQHDNIRRYQRFLPILYAGLLAILIPAAASAAPVAGTLDLAISVNQAAAAPVVDTCSVHGWARDPANTGALWVDFFADAPYGQPNSKYVGSTTANVYRADLPFTDKNHGFSFTFPAYSVASPKTPNPLLDGATHTIYAYGHPVASGTTGSWLQLSGSSIRCQASVATFGAVGTGTTNDGPAIQLAISNAGSNSVVYFPAGTYLIGTNQGGLTGCYSGSNCPTASTYVPYSTSDATRVIANGLLVGKPTTWPSSVVPGGYTPPTVANVKLLGEKAGATRLATLKLPGGSTALTKKLRLLTVDTNAERVTIAGLRFDGSGSGRAAGTGWPSADVVDGLVVGWMTGNTTVSDVEILAGLEDATGCWMCYDYRVSDSYLHDNGKVTATGAVAGAAGISIAKSYRSVAERNTITGNTAGIWIAHGSGDVALTNNIVSGHPQEGIAVGGSGADVSYIRMSGNSVYNNGAFGFAGVAIANAVDVANAELSLIPKLPVSLKNSIALGNFFLGQNSMTGNIVSGNGGSNVYVPGVHITGLATPSTTADGATTPAGYSRNWVIQGCNRIQGAHASSSYVQAIGVHIRNRTQNITVSGNQITGNRGNQPVPDPSNPYWQVVVEPTPPVGITIGYNGGC